MPANQVDHLCICTYVGDVNNGQGDDVDDDDDDDNGGGD